MSRFEIVIGVGKADDKYGYIAVKPPLDNALAKRANHSFSAVSIYNEVNNASEFELRQERFWSKDRLSYEAQRLQDVLLHLGHDAILLDGHCYVSGSASIFDQFEQQTHQTSD